MNIDALFSFFDSYVSLDAAEKDSLARCVKERQMKRKEFFLHDGQVCHHHGFVVSGSLRTYGIDDEGKEHNLQFAAENDWVVDLGSFYSGKASKLFIETLEPSHLLLIEKNDLIGLYKAHAKFVRYFKVIFENKFVEMQNRVLQNISSTAEERYLAFLEQYPHLSNRLPSIHIASYLGITPEFLSKVRKDISSSHEL